MRVNFDGLENAVTGLGTRKDKRTYNRWAYAMLNNWAELDACYQSNWIARAIVDVPAQDMTREWRRIKSSWSEEIEATESSLCLQDNVSEAISWARLFGGSAILMLTDQDLSKPLDLNRIRKGSLKRLMVFDRWEIPALTLNTWDVLSENYLRAQFHMVNGGQQQIHWSHFAYFMGERLPRRILAQTQGWGDSVLRKCIDDISDMVAAKDGIANLMQEANIDTITRTGLADALSSDQDDAIIKRYDLFSLMKSSLHMALLDGDETLTRQTLNLSGVAPIIEQFITWISGAARMPVTKLFGTSAKGLNATGEGDMRNYYDDLAGAQAKMERPLRCIDAVMVRSATGQWPDDFDYEWNPLEQPNAVEEAQAELLRAQRDAVYLESGVVERSQVMRNLQSAEMYQITVEQIDELEAEEQAEPDDAIPPVDLTTPTPTTGLP
jgi:hypothetical protein